MGQVDLDELLNQIKAGSGSMTREGMISLLLDWSCGPAIGETVEGRLAFREQWVSVAQADWVEILLGIAFDRPPEREMTWAEGWDGALGYLLESIVLLFPDTAFDRLTALLPTNDDYLRPYLIYGLGVTGKAEALPWLKPFVDNFSNLSEQERDDLVSAVAYGKEQERYDILMHLRPQLTEQEDELRDYLDEYLVRIKSNLR